MRWDWACTYPFVWKCNLLGGGRLFHLIYRLSLLQNLNDFIANHIAQDNIKIEEEFNEFHPTSQITEEFLDKKSINQKKKQFYEKHDKWVFQEGYIASDKGKYIPELFDIENSDVYDKIDSINQHNEIIFSDKKENKVYFHRRGSDITLFTLPMIVFNKKIGENYLPIAIKQEHNNKIYYIPK